MPTGRCSGCGWIAASKRVKLHVLTCQEFLDLFRTDSTKALDPEKDYAQFKDEENSSEARAERRDQRLRKRFAEMEHHQSLQTARWKTVDFLDG